jgi:hypothetical protein
MMQAGLDSEYVVVSKTPGEAGKRMSWANRVRIGWPLISQE